MNHPPAFIITIERNLQRARHTQQHLARNGIKAELWIGVDGAQPINFNPGESVDRQAFFARWLYHARPAQVGCYLSHYRLWQHALQHNLERILVLEDDIMPQPQLEANLTQILALDASHEYINISPFRPPEILQSRHQPFWDLPRNIGTGRLIVPAIIQAGLGTRGYIISRSGLQKSVPAMMPITATLDEQIGRLGCNTGLHSFDVWPGVLFHDDDAPNITPYGYRNITLRKKIFLRFFRHRTWLEHHRVKYRERAAMRQFAQQCLLEHQAAQPPSSTPDTKDAQ